MKINFSFTDDTHKPMRKRSILCVDQNEMSLPKEDCRELPYPSEYEPCTPTLPQCKVDDNLTNNYDDSFSDNEIPDTI